MICASASVMYYGITICIMEIYSCDAWSQPQQTSGYRIKIKRSWNEKEKRTIILKSLFSFFSEEGMCVHKSLCAEYFIPDFVQIFCLCQETAAYIIFFQPSCYFWWMQDTPQSHARISSHVWLIKRTTQLDSRCSHSNFSPILEFIINFRFEHENKFYDHK